MPRPFVVALLLLLPACAGTAVQEGPSTLHARNLLLGPGETIRLELRPGSTGVDLRPEFTPSDARVRLCREGEAPECFEPIAWGVRTPIRGSGIEALTIESDRAVTLSLTAEFFPLEPEIRVELPRAPAAPSEAACRENACRALFELVPVRTGTLTAGLTFEGDVGELAVLSGRILARSETATGVPYRVADVDRGSAPLEVSAQLDAGAEFAVVVGQRSGTGAGGVRDLELEMRWPSGS